MELHFSRVSTRSPHRQLGPAMQLLCVPIQDPGSLRVLSGCGLQRLSRPSSFLADRPFWDGDSGFRNCGGLGIRLAIGAFGFNPWGGSLWLATPTAIGGILGYRLRTGSGRLRACIVVLPPSSYPGFHAPGLAGVFCGLVLSAIVRLARSRPSFFGFRTIAATTLKETQVLAALLICR